ncbi:MAG: hypothetical protein ACOYUZ_03290 [Patescibacteria group bacterium]
MESADFGRLKFEWLYGVELFLDSIEGKEVLANLTGDVERKIFLMLLEWAIPVPEDIDEDLTIELNNWKNRRHGDAWNILLTGRFSRDDFWDQRAWEKDFDELREAARDLREKILLLSHEHARKLEAGSLKTPVVHVAPEDLEACLPSERITLACEEDPEAMERLKDHIAQTTMSQPLNISSSSPPDSKRSRTIPPPPTLHPTVPRMKVVVPPSITPSFAPKISSSNPPDESPEISFSAEEIDAADLPDD